MVLNSAKCPSETDAADGPVDTALSRRDFEELEKGRLSGDSD